MNKYFSILSKAVYTRKSRRKYLMNPLPEDVLEKLKCFINDIKVPLEHSVEINIHKALPDLPYLPFKNPPYFASFIAPKDIVNQAKVGFVGELLILYAESLGIGTCWYGHYNKQNTYKTVFGNTTENAKTIHCVTPLGYVTEKISGFSDKITTSMWSSKKKPVEEKLHQDSIKKFPDFIHTSLDMACKAPSAMNCQCWYFKVSEDDKKYSIEISKPIGYRHLKWPYTDIDVGTSASHFWLGLMNQGISPSVNVIENEGRAVWSFIINK
jgi:hypothetical protein